MKSVINDNMSIVNTAKCLETVAKPAAKAPALCGPPWAPKNVLHVVPLQSNAVDEALAKAKNVNGGKLTEAQADRIALAVPLVEKLTAESLASSVGDPMWNNIIGPIWAGKEYTPAPKITDLPVLTEPFIAKRG